MPNACIADKTSRPKRSNDGSRELFHMGCKPSRDIHANRSRHLGLFEKDNSQAGDGFAKVVLFWPENGRRLRVHHIFIWRREFTPRFIPSRIVTPSLNLVLSRFGEYIVRQNRRSQQGTSGEHPPNHTERQNEAHHQKHERQGGEHTNLLDKNESW